MHVLNVSIDFVLACMQSNMIQSIISFIWCTFAVYNYRRLMVMPRSCQGPRKSLGVFMQCCVQEINAEIPTYVSQFSILCKL